MRHSDQTIKRQLGFPPSDSNSDRAYSNRTIYTVEDTTMSRSIAGKEVVEISGHCKHQTTNAILWIPGPDVSIDESVSEKPHENGIWIPLSQVSEIHPDRLVVTRWIANQKGVV